MAQCLRKPLGKFFKLKTTLNESEKWFKLDLSYIVEINTSAIYQEDLNLPSGTTSVTVPQVKPSPGPRKPVQHEASGWVTCTPASGGWCFFQLWGTGCISIRWATPIAVDFPKRDDYLITAWSDIRRQVAAALPTPDTGPLHYVGPRQPLQGRSHRPGETVETDDNKWRAKSPPAPHSHCTHRMPWASAS